MVCAGVLGSVSEVATLWVMETFFYCSTAFSGFVLNTKGDNMKGALLTS